MQPFFSIIIPVYNCENTISQTLDSVLSQNFDDYELILVNDFSSDNTIGIINDYKEKFEKVTIINNAKNFGVAESRNIGVKNANGIYIALLDGDDIWMPDKLKKQKCIIEKTNCDICCTSYNFIDENSQNIKSTYVVPGCITYKMLLKENYIGCSTAIIKKELVLQNPMDKRYQHEDYALWLKLSRNGAKIIGIAEPLVKYRILSCSRSFNKSKAAKGRISIYINQEKFSLFKSFYYFAFYAFNGLKKKLL